MTVTFDAVTTRNIPGDDSYTHTPVGTPRGVLFMGVNNVQPTQFVSVLYGTEALSHISGSPFYGVAGGELMSISVMFLGTGIPTGAQTITVDTNNTAAKATVIVTLTAAADTTIDATATLDTVIQNPSFSLTTTASTNTWIGATLASGEDAVVNVAPGASFTQLYEVVIAAGTKTVSHVYRTSNGTGGAYTVDWATNGVHDAYALAVAVKEVGAAPPPTRKLTMNVSPRRW